MDKLALTNYFLTETGVNDTVAALADQNDDVVQAAHWIDTSWQSFQREKLWDFREAEKTMTVTSGDTEFTFTSLSMAAGDLIVPGSFYSSLGTIEHITYKALRALQRAGATTSPDKITHIAVKNSTIYTYPSNDAARTVEFDYWTAVQELDEDTDTPTGLPADFHPLIAHLAIARHGVTSGGQEGANLYQHHAREYRKILNEYLLWLGVDAETHLESVVTGTLL